MSEIGKAAVLELAKALEWPGVRSHGNMFGIEAGEEAWRLRITALSSAELREASYLLGELEERQAREADREARRAEAERPLEDDEPAAIETREMIAEARRLAERAEGPATRAQLDAVNATLREILATLRVQAK